ncbi:MAG: RcnB family protein [Sphingobium sp.]
MRKLVLAGLAAGLGGLAIPAAHAEDAGNAALAAGTLAQAGVPHAVRGPDPVAAPRAAAWGRRVNGRWAAGANAPGGWNGYYRPVPGWSLPSYWINPAFYIADWRGYGLPAPAAGYGWSRYYDDAVLTDRYGRVIDARYGYDWDRYGGYEDDGYGAPPPPYDDRRRDNTGNAVAGAVVGGVVGGIAGNVIAGRGNRTTGTVIGAGVGAVAGAALGASSGSPKKGRVPDYGYSYDGPPPRGYPGAPASYDGRWTGTWQGQDGSTYSGTYDGRFDGNVRGQYYYGEGAAFAPSAPLPYAPFPAYGYGYGFGYGSGYSAYTAEYVAPTVVTTTVTTEETTYSAVKKAAARKAVVRKPRPKPRVVCCPCGC